MFNFSQVKYELGDNEDIFAIDPNTGTILTKKEFDREKQDNYIVKVYAYDNSESALLKNGQPNQGKKYIFKFKLMINYVQPTIHMCLFFRWTNI